MKERMRKMRSSEHGTGLASLARMPGDSRCRIAQYHAPLPPAISKSWPIDEPDKLFNKLACVSYYYRAAGCQHHSPLGFVCRLSVARRCLLHGLLKPPQEL